jgi:hypothetical protein
LSDATVVEQPITNDADVIHVASGNAAPIPAKEASALEQYAPELVQHYAERFGWTPAEVEADRGKGYAIKKALDADSHIEAQKREIATLKVRVATMLQLIGKLSRPRAKAKPPLTPASNG